MEGAVTLVTALEDGLVQCWDRPAALDHSALSNFPLMWKLWALRLKWGFITSKQWGVLFAFSSEKKTKICPFPIPVFIGQGYVVENRARQNLYCSTSFLRYPKCESMTESRTAVSHHQAWMLRTFFTGEHSGKGIALSPALASASLLSRREDAGEWFAKPYSVGQEAAHDRQPGCCWNKQSCDLSWDMRYYYCRTNKNRARTPYCRGIHPLYSLKEQA